MAKKTDKKKESRELYTSSEVKRHMDVLMEDVRDQIKGIGERFVDFDRKLDLNTEMLETHEKRFDTIDQRLYSIDQKLDSHTAILNSHTDMIGALAEAVTVLKEDMTIIKEKVTSMEDNLKQKIDRKEFIVLERRVTAVEANV